MRRMALLVSCTAALALACGPAESGTDAAAESSVRADAPVTPPDASVREDSEAPADAVAPDSPAPSDAPVAPMDAPAPTDVPAPPMDAPAPTDARTDAPAPADARTDAASDAATGPMLAVDCTDVANTANPACAGPSSTAAGSIGTGPAMVGLEGGFIDRTRNRVVVATTSGQVMAVDLTTGDRTLISNAGAGAMVGTGPVWTSPHDVKQGSDGLYVVADDGVFRVNATTGNRTLVWDLASPACPGGGRPVRASLAVGPSNDLYLSLDRNPVAVGTGLIKFAAGACTIVSTFGAGMTALNRGSGASFTSGRYNGLRYQDGRVWAVNDEAAALLHFNLTTGERTVVSRAGTPDGRGTGPANGTRWFDFSPPTTVYTWGPFTERSPTDTLLVRASVVDGARVQLDARPNTPRSRGRAQGAAMWVHPSRPLLVLGINDAIVLEDPATQNSNVISR